MSEETKVSALPEAGAAASQGLMNSEYAWRKRGLMDLINSLRAIGASLDLDLPVITVIGNQSSGKSSLIEGISGITLKRSSGTCTHVPMEVRTEHTVDQPWSCKVYLRAQTDEDGNALKNIREVQFGPILTDPDQVELTLQRAQLALLNPSVDAKAFETYDFPRDESVRPLNSKKQLAFSRNIVCVEIRSPNVTDLTLIDLLGIISMVGPGEDKSSIGEIEDMAKHYISKDCLIVLTITMKDDINNQKACMLAQEFDPQGKRTIGVLTKPDTVQGSDVDIWLPVFKNEKVKLQHGYYVTRLPNTDELAAKISHDAARKKEIDFFASTPPWNTLDGRWKMRLGIANLTKFLSDVLLEMIKAGLPAIMETIQAIYLKASKELSSMPPEPSTDPAAELLILINAFHADLLAATEGYLGSEGLIRRLNEVYREFGEAIWQTAPRFTPFTRAEIDGDEEDEMDCSNLLDDIEGVDKLSTSLGGQAASVKNLDDVSESIEQSITRELPNNVPFACKVGLIKHMVSTWPAIVEDTFEQCRPVVESVTDNLTSRHFAKYEYGMLPARVRAIIEEKCAELALNTEAMLKWHAKVELRPYTQSRFYITDIKTKFLARLRDERARVTDDDEDSHVSEKSAKLAVQHLTEAGYKNIKLSDLEKLRQVEPFERELDVMAEVRAYYQVAYKRFVDNVPITIDAEYIRVIASAIRDVMVKELVAPGPDVAKRLLAEAPTTTNARNELIEKRKRIGLAKEEIRKYGLKF